MTDGEFLLPLVLDLAVLNYIFYLTGGAHNPFEGVFLVPVAMTAAHLRWRHTRIMLAVTVTCYTLLHFRHSHVLMADGTPVPLQLLQAPESLLTHRIPDRSGEGLDFWLLLEAGATHGQVSSGYEIMNNRRMPHFRDPSLPSRDCRDAGHGQPRMRSTR